MQEQGACLDLDTAATLLAIQGMALMELKTALAVLCAQFTFHPSAESDGVAGLRSAEVMALTMHVHGGIHLHCIPREFEGVLA